MITQEWPFVQLYKSYTDNFLIFFYQKIPHGIFCSAGRIRTDDQLVTSVFRFPKRMDYIITLAKFRLNRKR